MITAITTNLGHEHSQDEPGLAPAPECAPEVLQRLRAACQRAGFDEAALGELDRGPVARAATGLAAETRRPAVPSLATLIRLFKTGEVVDEREARAAVAPAGIEELAAVGLLGRHRGGIRGRFALDAYDGLLLASDYQSYPPSGDVVIGVTDSGLTLARMTIRGPVESVLDLGVGGGLQALLATRHAETVVGVDLNPRALALARFNAALNGVAEVALKQGSWLDPVADRRFDLVVANPPFVLSGERGVLFRDSVDDGVRTVISSLPAVLHEGGIAQLICQWPVRRGQEWSEPLREWIGDCDCHALLVRLEQVDLVAHASAWNEELAWVDPHAFREKVKRWIDHLRDRDYESIGFGMVALQRRGGTRSTHAVVTDGSLSPPAGEHVQRLLHAADALARVADDRELLERSFVALDGLRVHQTLSLRAGRYGVDPAEVHAAPGLGVSVRVREPAVKVVLGCRRGVSVRTLIAEAVERGDGGWDTVTSVSVAAIRDLVSAGLLWPDDSDGA